MDLAAWLAVDDENPPGIVSLPFSAMQEAWGRIHVRFASIKLNFGLVKLGKEKMFSDHDIIVLVYTIFEVKMDNTHVSGPL